MLKKWQQQQQQQQQQPACPAPLSFDAFAADAARLSPTRSLASTSELYSVYRTLHVQLRSPQLCLAPHNTCACFLVASPGDAEARGGRQYVVPMSKQRVELSMAELLGLLQAFEGGGGSPGGVLVATVDGDGSFSLTRMFASLQPPQGQ